MHDAIEDVEGEFERYPARSVLTFPARVQFRLRNTYWRWGAVIQGVSIRTGLDKCSVYMAIKLLWLKPDKHYITWKGSRLTSAQSSITGLYSVRYSPLHIIETFDIACFKNIIVTFQSNNYQPTPLTTDYKLNNVKTFKSSTFHSLTYCFVSWESPKSPGQQYPFWSPICIII